MDGRSKKGWKEEKQRMKEKRSDKRKEERTEGRIDRTEKM